jgi:hypothetical protein
VLSNVVGTCYIFGICTLLLYKIACTIARFNLHDKIYFGGQKRETRYIKVTEIVTSRSSEMENLDCKKI